MKQESEYRRRKAQVREAATEWQREFANASHSWGYLAEQANRWERLRRRYGLLREFRENGII